MSSEFKRGVRAALAAIDARPLPEPTGDVHDVYLFRVRTLLEDEDTRPNEVGYYWIRDRGGHDLQLVSIESRSGIYVVVSMGSSVVEPLADFDKDLEWIMVEDPEV